jgi:SAM-dependent methyltransferase
MDSVKAAVESYPLDNSHARASDHHNARSELFDSFSFGRARALIELKGADCLEIGYGGGSFASWLVSEVGPDGTVLATDIVPMDIDKSPQLTVIQHDVVTEPIPGTFDFIHARLVLGHLAEQRKVLTKLIQALRPGGAMLMEEWWSPARGDLVAHAPSPEAADLYNTFSVKYGQAMRVDGTDRNWARSIHGAMMDDGLVDVHTEMRGASGAGGGVGARMQQASMAQLRTKLKDAGITDELFESVYKLLEDPQLVLLGGMMTSTSGRKPS